MPIPLETTPRTGISVRLDVEDLAGLERVIGLLRVRRYDLRHIGATLGADGTWAVELLVEDDAPGARRLLDQLDRLVPVVVHQLSHEHRPIAGHL